MRTGRARGGIAIVVAAVLLVAACGQSTKPTAARSPHGNATNGPSDVSPEPGGNPTFNPSPTPAFVFLPSPSPTFASGERPPNGGPAPASAPRMNDALKCKIAVSNNSPGSGGFIVFPGGQFQPDIASNVSAPGGGNFGLSYVRSAQKWVPVGRSWIAADGSRYAYPDFQNLGVRVESLTGGGEVVLGSGQRWSVIDVEADAVYAAQAQGSYGQTSPGLWRLPMDGSAPVQVIDHGSWLIVTAGSVYGYALSNPPPGAPNPLVKHQLVGGAETTYQNLNNINIVGVDGDGRPIVETQNQGFAYLSMLLPNGALATFYSIYGYVQAPVVADQWGIWFTVNGQGPALVRWTNSGPHQAAGIGGTLGSGCF